MEKRKVQPQRPKAVLELLSSVDRRHEQHRTTVRHHPEEDHDPVIPRLVPHIWQTEELDVRPVHPCHHYAGVWYSERFQNASLALRSGRGSERQHRWTPKRLANCTQLAVVRAEVTVDEGGRDLLHLKVHDLLAHEGLQRGDHEPAPTR